MDAPQINVGQFRARPVGEVAALLPNTARAASAYADLAAAGIDVSQVQVLSGEVGVRIFDRDGTEHGYWSRLRRSFQNLTDDENVLDVYDEGLRKGESLLTIPTESSTHATRTVAKVLQHHGAHAMAYFGHTFFETLSAP